jgi:hypothetical protein
MDNVTMSVRQYTTVTLAVIIALCSFRAAPLCARGMPARTAPPLVLEIVSSRSLDGTAGDFVTVDGRITNTGTDPISDVTTYLSLVDTENKLPVDLEDWSVEKGLYIGAIGPGQSFPLSWKIHFVKAGRYCLVVIANVGGSSVPIASEITNLTVRPKRNLNPGAVLPVALGVPLILIVLLFILNVARKRE